MSKFNTFIYEGIKKAALKRVRIKCDPRLTSSLDFAHVDHYEGYILEECTDSISVMVIKQGMPIMSLPSDVTTQVEEPVLNSNKLSQFKQYIAKLFKPGDPLFSQIKSRDTIEEIENVLCQNGTSPEKFVHILRKFLNGDVLIEQIEAPGFLSNVGQVASNTAGALTNLGNAAQSINNLSNQLKQGNYGQVAKNITQVWDAAKEAQLKQLIKTYEWPNGYPKKGSQIKIINHEKAKLDNKIATVNQISKTGDTTTYTGSVLGLAGALGLVGFILQQKGNTPSDHNVLVRFTEGKSMSEAFTTNTKIGDNYILSFNSKLNRFELSESSSKDIELTVICQSTTKINEVGTFVVVGRLGSTVAGHTYRVKIISEPFKRIFHGVEIYVAHAVQV